MSFFPAKDPAAGDAPACDAIDVVIVPRPPTSAVSPCGGHCRVRRRMVGPFLFFDHMGPAESARPGHRRAAAPAYRSRHRDLLFDGEIMHRDSLGTEQPIQPGEINWMTAGRGIVHSERTAAARR